MITTTEGKTVRIFTTAWFNRFARRENLSDARLVQVVARAEKGLIEADLGGKVIKQRVARPGQGKSGGYRTILIFRHGDKAFFVYGFAKKERDTIRPDELTTFQQAAKVLLALSAAPIQRLIDTEGLRESTP